MAKVIIELPEFLDIPEKLIPLITEWDNYTYFVIEGGRGSAKTQTVGRILLYKAEDGYERIVCGREIEDTIDESVYTVLKDLIEEHEMFFDVQKKIITHRRSESEFKFKGFREQGRLKIKGLEGATILWIDEAESITKPTLDMIIPTVRKENSKVIFTMNRFLRSDPVITELVGRPDCLHIKINYMDNKHCPEKLKVDAKICKQKNEMEYRHIWLGEPLATAEDYLFNFDKIDLLTKIEPYGGSPYEGQRVAWFDYSGCGGDKCVGSLLERKSHIHWELIDQRSWSNPDTDVSIGKTIALNGVWNPNIIGGDADGLGYPMCVSIKKTIPNFHFFKGGETDKIYDRAANNRASAYLIFKEFVDQEWLIAKNFPILLKQMETIKVVYQRNGKIFIMSKKDMKAKDCVDSPDEADSVAMALFGIHFLLGKTLPNQGQNAKTIKRVNKSRRS